MVEVKHFEKRLKKIFKNIEQDIVLLNSSNLFWLTGIEEGAVGLFTRKGENFIFTNSLYIEHIKNIVADLPLRVLDKYGREKIEFIQTVAGRKLILVAGKYDVSEYKFMEKYLNLKYDDRKITTLRMVKDEEELNFIKKAVEITDKVFADLLKEIKVGMTELEVAGLMYYLGLKYGAEGFSFYPIVASGAKSSVPHAQTSNDKIKEGILLLDFGFKYNGYCSDMTRTIFVKEIPDNFEKIYNTCLLAQNEAKKAIKAGVKANELDKIARNIIEEAGFKGKFIHSLGHGLGIDVHEEPSVSSLSNVKLLPNTVITIEPGIYIEGVGGIRIEDDCVVKENGFVCFNNSPTDIIVI